MKIQKKKWGGGVGSGGSDWGGGSGGCERRIEVFCENSKKIGRGGGSGVSMGSGGGGAQGRCERKSKVFVKIQKKKSGGGSGRGSGWGVRVDVNGEVKIFENSITNLVGWGRVWGVRLKGKLGKV